MTHVNEELVLIKICRFLEPQTRLIFKGLFFVLKSRFSWNWNSTIKNSCGRLELLENFADASLLTFVG